MSNAARPAAHPGVRRATSSHAARPGADEERRSADEAMRLAIDAFDCGSALVDLSHRRLQWCSPGFSSHCCVYTDDALARLEEPLPGVAAMLQQLVRGGGPILESAVGSGASVRVQATLVRPGLAALRLLAPAVDAEASDAADPADARPRQRRLDSALERERAARRHLEDREKLLFTSRALSVGEMASTLAHELNQPIGTVANVLRGLRLRIERVVGLGAKQREDLQGGVQLAIEQALFASRIIARIREYTHSREPRRQALELGAVLRGSLALLDWEVQRDGVDLSLDLPEPPCPVEGDEVMLQQLFVNLLRNAIEAMRDNPPDARGRVVRSLRLALAVERGGREAVLHLIDNGCGLPSDVQQQLFVPFQSTKPNGMGIGLNICRSFAELHHGRLWFSPNEPGDDGQPRRGCTFHVALPLLSAHANGATATPESPP